MIIIHIPYLYKLKTSYIVKKLTSLIFIIHREKMAFFTRTKPSIPVAPDEEAENYSEDDWDEDIEERRTPDGTSSKNDPEIRRSTRCNSLPAPPTYQEHQLLNHPTIQTIEVATFEEPSYENVKPAVKEQNKTDEDKYEFVVDRVLGVQV